MTTPGPARRKPPTTPAPGPVETAVGLVLGQALPARPETWPMLRAHLLGVDGGLPVPAGEAAASVGESVAWLRGLLPRVRILSGTAAGERRRRRRRGAAASPARGRLTDTVARAAAR